MATIVAPRGANRRKTIVGRGHSSSGRRCGRGNNGQNARSGGGVRPGFEGGQMPLYRRVARRGFSNYPFKKEYVAISLDQIDSFFLDGESVNDAELRKRGLLKGKSNEAKILNGEKFDKKVTIEGIRISESAAEKVKSLGGEVR
ncbi:MAG TPA: 50S ribosomal protein L15 [Spirochaetaceae bacterium]|nr:50S ribosomal protein L15 [Spirochaetaceae bacterium]